MEALPTVEAVVAALEARGVTLPAGAVRLDRYADYAAIEGEGDGSLVYWRRVHWAFFGRECARIAREPSETMPVVCNVFEVLDVLPSVPSR